MEKLDFNMAKHGKKKETWKNNLIKTKENLT